MAWCPLRRAIQIDPKIKGGLRPTWGCPGLDPAKQVALWPAGVNHSWTSRPPTCLPGLLVLLGHITVLGTPQLSQPEDCPTVLVHLMLCPVQLAIRSGGPGPQLLLVTLAPRFGKQLRGKSSSYPRWGHRAPNESNRRSGGENNCRFCFQWLIIQLAMKRGRGNAGSRGAYGIYEGRWEVRALPSGPQGRTPGL